MHSNFNESEADNNFRSWLEEYKCPDKIIIDILKENSRWHYRMLGAHVKNCPRLFTALLDNGYKYEAIEHIFLDNHYSSYHWNGPAEQENIAIELVKNKCNYYYVPSICHFHSSRKFFSYKDFYIELYKNINSYPGIVAQDILKFFAADCDKNKLNKCIRNKGLTDLIIKNCLNSRMINGLLERDDYKTINIKNNKELLDLLLKENLIYPDKNDPNDKNRRKLVTKDSRISSLLKANDLKISDLIYAPVVCMVHVPSDITKKVEELTRAKIERVQAQSNLPGTHNAKSPNLAEQVMKKLKHDQDGVPSLMTLSVGAILNPQEKKIPKKPQIEKIKATRERWSNGCCNIL